MIIKKLSKGDEIAWDEFVAKHKQSTMYHLIGWKKVIESVFKYKSFYLMALNANGKIEGILPMFLMQDIFRKKFLISNPFSNFSGICANNNEAESGLIERAKKIAVEENVQYIEFRQLNNKIFLEPSKTDFVTFFLKLNRNSDIVWTKSLKAKTRNQVRKAHKSDLTINFSKNGLTEFYNVFSKNMRELGTPVLGINFFDSLLKNFPDNTEILLVKKDDFTIAGMFMFKFKNIVSDPWASSLREYNNLSPNNIMYWGAIKHACENKYEFFDLGRSTVNSGTYNFKKQWGAEPAQLFYQYYLNKAQTIPIVDAHNNKYQKYINLWKNLPLSITNFVGPKIVKYLPEL